MKHIWEPGKNEKESSHHQIRKSKAAWVHAWAFPLAAWNFSFPKSLSPFLARANIACKEQPTSIINWGYLFCFILISWGSLTSSTLLFCNKPIWLAQNRRFYERWSPPLLVFLFFLHMLLGPAWFCIKPHSMVLHASFILQKNLAMFF